MSSRLTWGYDMVCGLQQQLVPLIRDCYIDVLNKVMDEHNIPPRSERLDPVIPADVSFRIAVRYTDSYCGRRGQQHYRYQRYREVLRHKQAPKPRQAHVDIGCGAGLFSWVFLDWAKENNLAYGHIDLYGLDHSPEMIRLAQRMRVGLMPNIANYPELHYTHNISTLLQELNARHSPATDYTVTFGHVLVQAPHAIPDFARVIVHIMGLLDTQSNCVVMAVDALNASNQFAGNWNELLESLGRFGIQHKQITVRQTYINDSNRAKIAWLSRAPAEVPDDVDDRPF